MSGGRPRKPTNVKELHGDYKKDPQRKNRSEPIPSSQEIKPPPWLTVSARRIWDEIAPDRIEKGVLTTWDVDSFGLFCEALTLARQGVAEAYDKPSPGQPSPMSKFKEAVRLCATLGGQFGWTPGDRQKLVVGKDDGGSAEEYLSG